MARPNRHLPAGYTIVKFEDEWYLKFNGSPLLKRPTRKDAIYEMELDLIRKRRLQLAGG